MATSPIEEIVQSGIWQAVSDYLEQCTPTELREAKAWYAHGGRALAVPLAQGEATTAAVAAALGNIAASVGTLI
jgi:hypothetical protein